MLFQGQVQSNVPSTRASGNPNALQLQLGEFAGSQLLPRYAATTWSSQCFSACVATAANNTAFTGGAGGTPFLAVWNPAGSGKNLWPIIVNWGVVVSAGTSAGNNSWALWYGPTAAVTAAASSTFPINQLTMQATGSVAKAFINTATTSSTALTNMLPVGSYYWASAAGAFLVANSQLAEVFGGFSVPPGSMMAFGGSTALTSSTYIAHLAWIELPV